MSEEATCYRHTLPDGAVRVDGSHKPGECKVIHFDSACPLCEALAKIERLEYQIQTDSGKMRKILSEVRKERLAAVSRLAEAEMMIHEWSEK